jgi:hypothetical protein
MRREIREGVQKENNFLFSKTLKTLKKEETNFLFTNFENFTF